VTRRRLDTELVRRGLAESRTRAAAAIAAGRVLVGGAPATSPARQVGPADALSVTGDPAPYVSRGGIKLAAALDRFVIDVDGLRVLDAGASTGGFTDCLLARGAARVYAVDVGRGQLAWSLRQDARVVVLERTNVRHLQPEQLDGPVPLAVADLSFMSVVSAAPALVRCTTPDADLVLLVKPQFEAGRRRIGKRGIVRDPAVHAAVLTEVTDALDHHGLVVVDAAASPIHGADGNREFFVRARHDGAPIDRGQLTALAREGSDRS
jgi:23S rRNA (cytidine1920-2'-O)/16S rRNA (cytidine1409-2'-O)-methyltransferase